MSTRKLHTEKVWHDFTDKSELYFSEPDPDTVEYLRKGLRREYELYNYIKQIFYEKIDFLKEKNLWWLSHTYN